MKSHLLFCLTLILVAHPASGQVFWSDDFESTVPSFGTRTVSGFANTDGGFCTNDYFLRTNQNVGDHPEFAANFTNLSGSFYWRAEDFDSCAPATGEITWSAFNITGRSNLTFTGRFGSRDVNTFENTDFITVQWQIDGGGFMNGLCFAGGGGAGSDLTVDADCNGTGDAASTELVEALSNFDFSIPMTGDNLELRLQASSDGGGEEIAFDFFRISEGTLPVELTTFDVRVSDQQAVLSWQTATETDNSGFEIQTRTGPAPWQTLGFVDGAGTTLETQSYTYQTGILAPGTHQFRLKQIDFDGTSAFSPIVEAMIEVPGTHVLTAAYPNPFNPSTQLTLTVARRQQVKLEVFDVSGRQVRTLYDGPVVENTPETFRFEAEALPGGLYMVRATGENFVDSQQVMLVK